MIVHKKIQPIRSSRLAGYRQHIYGRFKVVIHLWRFLIFQRSSLHPPNHIKPSSAHSSSGIHPPYSLGIHQPGIHQPGIHQPGIHQPGIHQPGIHQPGIHQPGIHQPGEQSQFVHPIRPPVPGIRQPGEIKKAF